jgi:putative glutamine amidotransferase
VVGRQAARRRSRIGVSWLPAAEAAAHACVRAVEAAGGEPVPLLREAESWTESLPGLDGLILTGGNAVDPRRYGEENHGLCRVIIPRRDDLEREALEHCVRGGKPVLGVCRGMQFLNVALGGRMLQDLTITTVQHEQTRDRDGEYSRFHPVDVAPGTRLAAIVRHEGTVRVNSRHHQGLRAEHVAPDLRVSAVAPDGVVEGVEAVDGRFVVGIQFHPELPGEVPEVAPIFDVLVAHARER